MCVCVCVCVCVKLDISKSLSFVFKNHLTCLCSQLIEQVQLAVQFRFATS